MNKRKYKKYNMGGALQSLAPLAGMIPGVGPGLSMAMGLTGGIANNIAAQKKMNEELMKANVPQNNTPTGTLGIPNYKMGGKLSKMLKTYKDGGGLPGDPPKIFREFYKSRKAYNEALSSQKAGRPYEVNPLAEPLMGSISLDTGNYDLGIRGRLMTATSQGQPGMTPQEYFQPLIDDVKKKREDKAMNAIPVQYRKETPINREIKYTDQFNLPKGDAAPTQPEKATGLYPNTNPLGFRQSTKKEYKYGGKMNYRHGGKMLKGYEGPNHEQGGMPVNGMGNPTSRSKATAEVEGGETYKDGYVYSDSLLNTTGNTFAEDSKMINKKYSRNNTPDWLKNKTKDIEFKRLQAKNDNMREMVEQVSGGMPEMRKGGYLKNDDTYITKDGKPTKRGLWANVYLKKKREGKLAYGGKLNTMMGGGSLPKYNNGGPQELKNIPSAFNMQGLGVTNFSMLNKQLGNAINYNPTRANPFDGSSNKIALYGDANNLPTAPEYGVPSTSTSSPRRLRARTLSPITTTSLGTPRTTARLDYTGLTGDNEFAMTYMPSRQATTTTPGTIPGLTLNTGRTTQMFNPNPPTAPTALGQQFNTGINMPTGKMTLDPNRQLRSNEVSALTAKGPITSTLTDNALAPPTLRDPNDPDKVDVNQGTDTNAMVGEDGKLTVGDRLQMASNFISPAFNLAAAMTGYDEEPEQKNKYATAALNRLRNLKIRPDLNPIIAQANAARTAIQGGASGMQRIAAQLGLTKQTGQTLETALRNAANQNAQLSQALSQTELQMGERDRAEAIRAKGTTDANKAARFNMVSKAFEQLGPAVGTIGSGKNKRLENEMSYNLLKQIYPDFTPAEFGEFMATRANKAIQYKGKKYQPINPGTNK